MKYCHALICIWGIIGLALASGCSKKEKPLRPQGIKLVDTLVAQQWKTIEPLEDSLCHINKNNVYQRAYDSIMEIRIVEKNELIRYELR